MAVILGTAGHIDHGKTTLIQALTGMDCDRLAEEKKRGITIDLGFAWLDLPKGERLGIIDVPGHEKFVRNMVAGAMGIDLVMLVIAADEGVMPQTREHLEICSLLGVKTGLVVLTKADMVEADWLELVKEEIQKTLKGSFLENCKLLAVSAKTGEGIEELKAYLVQMVEHLPAKKSTDLFRLPIDRVFTLKGHGTVVTGTVLQGQISVGENVEIMPSGLVSKVRSLERHGEEVSKIFPGSRCALNLQNLDTKEVERGQIVAKSGELFPRDHWYIKLTMLESAPFPLKNRTELHFHHCTKECQARIVLKTAPQLKPGESTWAQVLFPTQMCAVFGDYAVLRSGSPLRTIAGCQVIAPLPPKKGSKRAKDPNLGLRYLELLKIKAQEQAGSLKAREVLISEVLDLQGEEGLSFKELKVATALSSHDLEATLNLLSSQGQIILWDKETRSYLSKSHFEALQTKLLERAEELHKQAPLQKFFAKPALMANWCQNLPEKLAHKVLEASLKQQKILPEGEGLRLATHNVALKASEEDLAQKILAIHREAKFTPPNFKEVVENLKTSEKACAEVLKLLIAENKLIRVKEGLYYHQDALDEILQLVRDWFKEHDNLDIASLKTLLGLSRKYLVVLLEYMDNAHITMRVGDKRKLRKTL
ncbi:MAG: selenocysteine-specific translation elongation factor [Desulfovibrionaceae bacterium]|nr:selenocysteine-specific translation elongation factor [Desulfovibrionaceae bacterium]